MHLSNTLYHFSYFYMITRTEADQQTQKYEIEVERCEFQLDGALLDNDGRTSVHVGGKAMDFGQVHDAHTKKDNQGPKFPQPPV